MGRAAVGERAPNFDLPGTGGRRYRLGDYVGTSGVILAFYPGDETPVCTKQFCAYRDGQGRLEALGIPLLGISPQGIDSHTAFADNHDLTVPLLADTDKAVGKAYGVVGGPFNVYRRSVFVVDREGMVRYRQVSAVAGLSFMSIAEIEGAVAQTA